LAGYPQGFTKNARVRALLDYLAEAAKADQNLFLGAEQTTLYKGSD